MNHSNHLMLKAWSFSSCMHILKSDHFHLCHFMVVNSSKDDNKEKGSTYYNNISHVLIMFYSTKMLFGSIWNSYEKLQLPYLHLPSFFPSPRSHRSPSGLTDLSLGFRRMEQRVSLTKH